VTRHANVSVCPRLRRDFLDLVRRRVRARPQPAAELVPRSPLCWPTTFAPPSLSPQPRRSRSVCLHAGWACCSTKGLDSAQARHHQWSPPQTASLPRFPGRSRNSSGFRQLTIVWLPMASTTPMIRSRAFLLTRFDIEVGGLARALSQGWLIGSMGHSARDARWSRSRSASLPLVAPALVGMRMPQRAGESWSRTGRVAVSGRPAPVRPHGRAMNSCSR